MESKGKGRSRCPRLDRRDPTDTLAHARSSHSQVYWSPQGSAWGDEGSAPGSPTANLGALAREVALACHLVHLWPHSKTLTDKQWLFDGTGQVIVFPGMKTK